METQWSMKKLENLIDEMDGYIDVNGWMSGTRHMDWCQWVDI